MKRLTKAQILENAVTRLKNNPNLKAFELQNSMELQNSGFQVDIDTLTGIKQRVTTQKFFEIRPSEFMPVVVGENAWSSQILTYKDFSHGDDFESGNVEAGTNDGRLSQVDAKIEGILVPTIDWAKAINYNLMELAKASQAGNWSLIESKERARVKNWQLGIQKIAFLGSLTNTNVKGLLTQSDVTSNTAVIAKNISTMTATEFQSLLALMLEAYSANSDITAMPDTFAIPSDDYNGLASAVNEEFNMKSRLQRLKEMFMEITDNPNFKIKSLAYGKKEKNLDFLGSGSGLNRYALYRGNDEESLRMDIPVDYTTTIQDTINGFSYQSVGYGEYTGAKAYRPKEMLYFDHSI